MYSMYKFYAECISDKVNKIKFLKKINRVASWEDCREMCNNNDECVQFKFKVKLSVDFSSNSCINIVCISVTNQITNVGSQIFKAEKMCVDEKETKNQEWMGVWR